MSVEIKPGIKSSPITRSVVSTQTESGYKPMFSISPQGNMKEIPSPAQSKRVSFANNNNWSTLYKRYSSERSTTSPDQFKRTFDTRGFRKLTVHDNPFSLDRQIPKYTLRDKSRVEYQRPEMILNRSTHPSTYNDKAPLPTNAAFSPNKEVFILKPPHVKITQSTDSRIYASLWNETHKTYSREKNERTASGIRINPHVKRLRGTQGILHRIELRNQKKVHLLAKIELKNRDASSISHLVTGSKQHLENSQLRNSIPPLTQNTIQTHDQKHLSLPQVKTPVERKLLLEQAKKTVQKMQALRVPDAEKKMLAVLQDRLSNNTQPQVEQFSKTKVESRPVGARGRVVPIKDLVITKSELKRKTKKQAKQNDQDVPHPKSQLSVPERDIITDSRRVEMTVKVGRMLLASKRHQRGEVTGEMIAKHMPSNPGASLSSRIRHQLRLPLTSEEQYDVFKYSVMSKGTIRTVQDIAHAAKQATNDAPAVQLNRNITTERVRVVDERRATSNGGAVVYQR